MMISKMSKYLLVFIKHGPWITWLYSRHLCLIWDSGLNLKMPTKLPAVLAQLQILIVIAERSLLFPMMLKDEYLLAHSLGQKSLLKGS